MCQSSKLQYHTNMPTYQDTNMPSTLPYYMKCWHCGNSSFKLPLLVMVVELAHQLVGIVLSRCTAICLQEAGPNCRNINAMGSTRMV